MSEGAPDYGPQDLVVCVDAKPNPFYGGDLLKVGAVYTVARFSEKNGVYLAEVDCPAPFGFRADRFRRLDPLPPEFFAGRVEEGVGVEA